MSTDAGYSLEELEAGGVIDLTSVKEQSFDPVPAGTYDAFVEDVEFRPSKQGNPMLAWRFRTRSDENATNNRVLFWHTTLHQEVGLQQLKAAVVALDQGDINLDTFSPTRDAGMLIGRDCRIRVGIQKDDASRNDVKGVLSPSGDETGFVG